MHGKSVGLGVWEAVGAQVTVMSSIRCDYIRARRRLAALQSSTLRVVANGAAASVLGGCVSSANPAVQARRAETAAGSEAYLHRPTYWEHETLHEQRGKKSPSAVSLRVHAIPACTMPENNERNERRPTHNTPARRG